MNRRRLRALLAKEWAEAVRNRTVVWTFVALAALFVALPLLLAFGFAGPLGRELERDPRGAAMLDLLAAQQPALESLAPEGRLQVMVLRQMLPLFLVLPLMGGIGIATYSVVGEKVSRSLEPLLATPITAGELLLGKTVAAALPATAGTWIAFGLFAAGVRGFGGAAIAGMALDLAAWTMMALLVPLVALFGIGAGVVVSARARDPRGAQQIGGLLVLPVVALVAAQSAGVFLLGPGFVLAGALALALADAALLAWGSRRFDRERVFVDWR